MYADIKMNDRYIKWMFYTVVVGLIPIIVRLFVCLITNSNSMNLLVPSDIIVFGLVLHISTLNEIEHFENEDNWKTKQIGVSIIFMILYSILMASALFSEIQPALIDMTVLLYCSVSMAIVSLLLTSSVFDRGRVLANGKETST